MSIFSRVCDAKAEDPFNCVLFKCCKFMKGLTDSALSRTKYVKCFRVETSCYWVYFDWNSSWLWNYCTIKGKVILSNVKQKFNWNRIVHQNALQWLYGVWSTTRPWNKQTIAPDASQPSSQERWQVADLKHLKTSYIFSLPRISTKDFPYIKGKIDRSIGINYSSVNFKWTQVFLCYQSFDRRGQWIFIKYRSYKISLNQRVSLWYGWELRWIELGCVRRSTSQEIK